MHVDRVRQQAAARRVDECLSVDGLDFEVRRSSRRKTVGLLVERDRALIVQAPEGVDREQLRAIVRSRLVWIHTKLEEVGAAPTPLPFRRRDYVDGEGFYFLGRHYRLRLHDPKLEDGPTPAIILRDGYFWLRRDQLRVAERRFAEWYARQARPYLNAAVRRLKTRVGVSPPRYVNVADLGYRWGSCGAGGVLHFHWRTIQLPPSVIDYVVVHELAHLRVPNHDPAFWAEVERVLPDYDSLRRWLKENGGRL
jgi:predicted metal-dependent hydrolase